MLEGFTPIPEYPEYLISRSGEVYSTKVNRTLAVQINTSGYPFFAMFVGGKQKFLLLHRTLARVYGDLPSLDSELEVDHDDRNKLNFSLGNLIVRESSNHREKTTIERGQKVGGNRCPECGKRIQSKNLFCKDHTPRPFPSISAESIEYWVSRFSWVRASKELGLSDNGLRKRYKSLTGKDPKSIEKITQL